MSHDSSAAIRDGCYYLHKLGLGYQEISDMFGIEMNESMQFVNEYKDGIEKGEIEETSFDQRFWEDILKESSGNSKVTLVNEKQHFFHGRKSDLEKMSTEDLIALFEVNKDFLLRVPQVVLDSLKHHKIGYNPLLPFRQVQESVKLLEKILEKRANRA